MSRELTPGTIRHFQVGLYPIDEDSLKRYGPDMSLIAIIVTLVIIGVLLWLVNSYIPMDHKIKTIINVIVVIAVVLWLLSAFGIIGGGGDINMPNLD